MVPLLLLAQLNRLQRATVGAGPAADDSIPDFSGFFRKSP